MSNVIHIGLFFHRSLNTKIPHLSVCPVFGGRIREILFFVAFVIVNIKTSDVLTSLTQSTVSYTGLRQNSAKLRHEQNQNECDWDRKKSVEQKSLLRGPIAAVKL